MREWWFLVALLVAVLALGITAGIALAQTGNSSDDAPLAGLAPRVASILGLDEVEVKRAFDRAERDSQDERHLERLKQYVEHGCLTQQEAERYYEWFQCRPEGILPGRSHFKL